MVQRTKKQIKDQMTSEFIDNTHIKASYGLSGNKSFEQEFSIVSIENILFEVFALAVYILESLFYKKEAEINEKLLNQKSGRLSWYRHIALQFHYGFNLITDSDQFDVSGATAEQIENSKVIKYAAVNEGDVAGTVIVKVATETLGELTTISSHQQLAFESYINELKYAGTRISVINFLADKLILNMQIEVDPLVIDQNGTSILNGNEPVKDALKEFMKELPFDGELILQSLIDKLQNVDGVKIATLIEAKTSWLDTELNDYGNEQTISVKKIPVSGYFKIENFDNINYVV